MRDADAVRAIDGLVLALGLPGRAGDGLGVREADALGRHAGRLVLACDPTLRAVVVEVLRSSFLGVPAAAVMVIDERDAASPVLAAVALPVASSRLALDEGVVAGLRTGLHASLGEAPWHAVGRLLEDAPAPAWAVGYAVVRDGEGAFGVHVPASDDNAAVWRDAEAVLLASGVAEEDVPLRLLASVAAAYAAGRDAAVFASFAANVPRELERRFLVLDVRPGYETLVVVEAADVVEARARMRAQHLR